MHSYDNNLEYEYKQLKKQLKLLRGLSKAPAEHRPRMSQLLAELSARTGLVQEEEIERKLEKIRVVREENERQQAKLSEGTALKCWFIRPLLSHLDHPGKIKSLADPKSGLGVLTAPVKLHIPGVWRLPPGRFDLLKRYFSFKAFGKGSAASAELEKKFLDIIEINHNLPFSAAGITDLPLLHYNIERFWSEVAQEDRHVTIVSGLCPLSLISDELTFVSPDGKESRPETGFMPLDAEILRAGGSIKVRYPPRPIFGDYIELVRVLKLANTLSEVLGKDRVSLKFWLPMNEYYTALVKETFVNLIDENIIDAAELSAGLNELAGRYEKLVNAAVREQHYEGDLSLTITDERSVEMQEAGLEAFLGAALDEYVDEQLPVIYGLYKGTTLRKKLFALLAYKHMQPMLDDDQTSILHVENSYEIWPSVLAARWVGDLHRKARAESGEVRQAYSFLCTPSVPSPSLKYMRALNAPYDHKLYLAGSKDIQKDYFKHTTPKYLKLLSVLIPDFEPDKFESRIKTLQTIFS